MNEMDAKAIKEIMLSSNSDTDNSGGDITFDADIIRDPLVIDGMAINNSTPQHSRIMVFRYSIFKDVIIFKNCMLSNMLFVDCEFDKMCIFENCILYNITFKNSTFFGGCSFRGSIFVDNVILYNITFDRGVIDLMDTSYIDRPPSIQQKYNPVRCDNCIIRVSNREVSNGVITYNLLNALREQGSVIEGYRETNDNIDRYTLPRTRGAPKEYLYRLRSIPTEYLTIFCDSGTLTPNGDWYYSSSV